MCVGGGGGGGGGILASLRNSTVSSYSNVMGVRNYIGIT